MRPESGDVNFQNCGIAGQHLVDAIGRDRDARVVMPIVFQGTKQCALGVVAVAGRLQVTIDDLGRARV